MIYIQKNISRLRVFHRYDFEIYMINKSKNWYLHYQQYVLLNLFVFYICKDIEVYTVVPLCRVKNPPTLERQHFFTTRSS